MIPSFTVYISSYRIIRFLLKQNKDNDRLGRRIAYSDGFAVALRR